MFTPEDEQAAADRKARVSKEGLTEAEMSANEETAEHIDHVRWRIAEVIGELRQRSEDHDASKMQRPEVTMFAEYGPKLRQMKYGTDEYNECLDQMKKTALKHHYEHNRHHPEHFPDGVDDMNLIDILEMFCDWKAATERMAEGDIENSIRYNQSRFNISPQLANILRNTARDLGWLKKPSPITDSD